MPTLHRFSFTQQAVAGLAPAAAGERTIYHDSRVPGLQLMVTAKGARSFYVRKKTHGKSERIHLGTFPGVSVEQARRGAQEVLGRFALGHNPAEARRVAESGITLGQLFEEYRRRTAKFMRRPDKPEQNFRLYLSQWRERKLSSITFADVDALHKELATRISPVTANIALKLLHALFNKAKFEWRIWSGDNPAHGIKKFKESSRDRFVVPEEMRFLLAAIELEENRTIADAVSMALFTGARRSNILEMAWGNLDLGAGLWRIPRTKNGQPQLVHLCPQAVALLGQRNQGTVSKFVFPGPGNSGHLEEVKSGWARILTRVHGLRCLHLLLTRNVLTDSVAALWAAKLATSPAAACRDLCHLVRDAGMDPDGLALAGVRFHDLRRTHGSWMLRAGAAKHLVGKQLNHLSPQATDVYARFLPGEEGPYVDGAVAQMLKTRPGELSAMVATNRLLQDASAGEERPR